MMCALMSHRFISTTGRNAPCPCGSGKKYKHCHGQLAAVPSQEELAALFERSAAEQNIRESQQGRGRRSLRWCSQPSFRGGAAWQHLIIAVNCELVLWLLGPVGGIIKPGVLGLEYLPRAVENLETINSMSRLA